MAEKERLHLPSLRIVGFRAIDALTIPRLGRVTLLTGKNSVGKTTVLDAARVYAARGRHSALADLLTDREEFSVAIDEDGVSETWPDLAALFYGRKIAENACLLIGPVNGANALTINAAPLDPFSDEVDSILGGYNYDISPDEDLTVLKVNFQRIEQIIPWVISSNRRVRFPSEIVRRRIKHSHGENEMPAAIECESVGPGLMSNQEMARFWEKVVLTDDETKAIEALRHIFGPDIAGAAVVGDEASSRRRSSRRVLVKLKNHERPVPLRSLGDGAARLYSIALALANCRGGFLLIDEAENGIHHTVQADYWRMVLQAAQANDVQVLATTHSDDCARGFAQAAIENEDVEGVLVRIEKDAEGLYAVEYSEERLQTATRRGSEVR